MQSTNKQSTNKPLTDNQRKLIFYLEEWWHSHSSINEKLPTQEQMVKDLKQDSNEIARSLKEPSVLDALERRGITYADVTLLQPEQLAAANVILDFSDGRTQKKKLEDLGISTQRYNGWLKQPRFQRYMRMRAESLLGEVQHEAHVALLKNVQRGDLNSIKLYYEMTGRWSSKPAAEINLDYILLKVVEAVQKYVKDPAAIQGIARELGSLLPQTDVGGSPVVGSAIPAPLTNGAVGAVEPAELEPASTLGFH